MKRRRHPRIPEFPPLEELAPGAPFNPYALLEGWSVRKAIAGYPKLRPAAKFLYMFLADQVYTSDYDSHSQRTLADFVGLSVDQFQYHLARLAKHGFVKVAHDIGRQNYLWLLWHPVFAGCSPLTGRRTPVGGTGELRQGVPENSGTQRNYQRNYQRSASGDSRNGTSSRGSVEQTGEEEAKRWDDGENRPELPITESSETLTRRRDFASFWYSLSPVEKRNRAEAACRVHDRIQHLRTYLNGRDANAARQARQDIAASLAELAGLGFTLHTNGRKAP